MPIVVKDLTYAYSEGGRQNAPTLKNLSFTVQEGAFFGIIGHTGSGKSTLVQHLNGLIPCQSGSVTVDEFDLTDKKQRRAARAKVGMVFQYPEYQLFAETVFEDIAFGAKNLKLEEAEIERRVLRATELVGLDAARFRNKSPFELSGGEKRRVAMAGVLVTEPKYLILDEPMAGLDPKGRKEILALLERLRSELSCTILMISHSMDDIARHCSEVLVLREGEIAYLDTPSAVFSHAEELEALGLSIPQVTKLSMELRRRGIDVPPGICTLSEWVRWLEGRAVHA